MDTLIRKIFYYIMKINNFRGDLTDISAKKEALMAVCIPSLSRIVLPLNFPFLDSFGQLYLCHRLCNFGLVNTQGQCFLFQN